MSAPKNKHVKRTKKLIFQVVDEIREWIIKNIENDISTATVLLRAGYSKWHFQRVFYQRTGETVSTFILKIKIQKSREDVAFSGMKFTDIAVKYGFNSQETYIRSFRRVYDMTPSEMRKSGFQPIVEKHSNKRINGIQ